MNNRDAQGALNLLNSATHCIDQASFAFGFGGLESVSDEVSQNLGIGLREEGVTGLA